MNVATYNDRMFAGAFQFGRKPKMPKDIWEQRVAWLYSYYKQRQPDWNNPHWDTSYKQDLDPSEAVHALIGPPEYEVDEEAEVHVDADVMEARAAVGRV